MILIMRTCRAGSRKIGGEELEESTHESALLAQHCRQRSRSDINQTSHCSGLRCHYLGTPTSFNQLLVPYDCASKEVQTHIEAGE